MGFCVQTFQAEGNSKKHAKSGPCEDHPSRFVTSYDVDVIMCPFLELELTHILTKIWQPIQA